MQPQFEKLVTVAGKCAEACERCAASCLDEADIAAMTDCIKLDRDCAEVCRLISSVGARGSRFTTLLAAVLVDVCKACAEECARHDMDHCRVCASACRACAVACSESATE